MRCLTALTFSLVALTGCSGESDGQTAATAPVTSATPSASADETAPTTAPAGGTDPDGTPSSTSAAPWAGTKQFVQIEDARTSDGRTYLSVRPAQKKAHTQFEAWVIVPGEGPYTEVRMAEDAKVLLSVPLGDGKHASSYSQAEFVSRLTAQPSTARSLLGYDLSFDGEGRVTRLQSLYTRARHPAAGIAHRRTPQRHHAAPAAGRRRAAGAGQAGPAPAQAPRAVCRPWLRPRQLPPPSTRARHRPEDRPARTATRLGPGPCAMGCRVRHRLAPRPSPLTDPLGNPRRHA